MASRAQLLTAAQNFCDAFSQKSDIESIVSNFSATFQAEAIEHGDSALAAFLGRNFVGIDAIKSYFELVSSHLTYEDIKFAQHIVDIEGSKVVVTATGKFTWKSTGESWKEQFLWILVFDEDLKITNYQVWADSGSAYLASQGKLEELRKASYSFEPFIQLSL
ncbi:hypothetical protein C8J56DRAFT_857917 [Mycena floridula]|nr:hypothetical protein C8J56DRAFT_857917 [Mycena floridula]